MYIEPNTTIKLYSGIPLDDTYEHTLYFASLSAQSSYFHGGIAKYTLASNSYQRVERGKMRIEKKADDIYDCNYLAFQNSNYGNKWFYAFITEVEYVNNITSEVTFEIDSMQTYLFDIDIKDCFVEREHSLTDDVGDNLLPEDASNIICAEQWGTEYFDHYHAIIAHAIAYQSGALDPATPTGGVVSGLYNGIDYLPASLDSQADIDDLNDLLHLCARANSADEIASIFLMPTDFIPPSGYEKYPVEYDKSYSKATAFKTYVPQNKKLLTYPYNFLHVECGNDSIDYKYELFNTNDCKFTLSGVLNCDPQIALIPHQYNQDTPIPYGDPLNTTKKLVMKDFPQVAWVQNSYATWLGTHHLSESFKALAGAGAMAVGAMTENPMITVGGAYSLMNSAITGQQAKWLPDQIHTGTWGTHDVATKTKNFWFERMQLTVDSAKAIDSFFSKFGYTCNRIKKPNISSRPHWNYVKTKGCVAIGKAPSDDIRKVCKIYDHGITFWKTPSEVGTYTDSNGELINNSPI